MAARKMMERENVLTLDEVQKLFNKFFREHHKFYGDLLEAWITHPQAKKRLFGITRVAYNAMSPAEKNHGQRTLNCLKSRGFCNSGHEKSAFDMASRSIFA